MTLLPSLLVIVVLVILNAIIHGWARTKHDSIVDRGEFMIPIIIVTVMVGVTGIIEGPMLAFRILAVLGGAALFVFGLSKLAKFFSNYSFRKFSGKQ